MIILLLLFVLIIVAMIIYFHKKKMRLRWSLCFFATLAGLIFIIALVSPTGKHIYNIVEHDISRYEIIPVADLKANQTNILTNLEFPRSGMYEVVLVKGKCIRDSEINYGSKIILSSNGKELQKVMSKRQNHATTGGCRFPYLDSYILGFFNVPFIIGKKLYKLSIDIEPTDGIDKDDRLIIRQSLYF